LVVTGPASVFYMKSIIYQSVPSQEVSDSIGIGYPSWNHPN